MVSNMKRILDILPDVSLTKRTFHDEEICLNNHESGSEDNCLVRQWMIMAGGQFYSSDACRKYAAELMDLAEQAEHLNNGQDITRLKLGDPHIDEKDKPEVIGSERRGEFDVLEWVNSIASGRSGTAIIGGNFPPPPLEGDPTENDIPPEGIEEYDAMDTDRIEDKDDDR